MIFFFFKQWSVFCLLYYSLSTNFHIVVVLSSFHLYWINLPSRFTDMAFLPHLFLHFLLLSSFFPKLSSLICLPHGSLPSSIKSKSWTDNSVLIPHSAIRYFYFLDLVTNIWWVGPDLPVQSYFLWDVDLVYIQLQYSPDSYLKWNLIREVSGEGLTCSQAVNLSGFLPPEGAF